MNKISETISQEYQEFGCLNFEAKSKYMCKVMGDIFLPPAGFVALLKYGPKAVKQFPNLKGLYATKAGKSIWGKYPKLQKTLDGISIKAGRKVSHPREIPFSLTQEFRPVSSAEMMKRADELEPDLRNTVAGVYNALGDKAVLDTYFKKLFQDSAEWMASKGRPEDLKLLKEGVISEHAIAVTLVKRFKASGDNGFTTIVKGKGSKYLSYGSKEIDPDEVATRNDSFRTAIRTGPFIDRFFKEGSRENHGVFTHMIQRDIVSDVVKKEMKGNPEKFWNFLGSKKGVNWWADLFDSGDKTGTFARPESITGYVLHNLTDNKLDNKP